MTGEVCLDDDKFGQMGSQHGQIIKSGLSDGRRAKFLPSVAGMTTIGYELGVIWGMSAKLGLGPVPGGRLPGTGPVGMMSIEAET